MPCCATSPPPYASIKGGLCRCSIKLVAIEPVSLIPSAEQELHQYAEEVTLYRDIPADDDEIVRRIGDADAVLLSYTSRMGKNA